MIESVKKLDLESKSQLVELLSEYYSHSDSGMNVIAKNFACGKESKIDLLGIDGDGRLKIILGDIVENDHLVLDALYQFHWVIENLQLIFPKLSYDYSQPPEIVLISPNFSTRVKTIVRFLGSVRIDLVEFRYLELKGEKGLLLEPVVSSLKTVRTSFVQPTEAKTEPQEKTEPEEKTEKKVDYDILERAEIEGIKKDIAQANLDLTDEEFTDLTCFKIPP